MSKFLVYTDFHLTGKRPSHRVDDYTKSLITKVREVYSYVDDYDVDFVLFLGDFFNNHRMYSYELINEVMEIIGSCRVPTYAIIGQHDLVGYNPDSYKTSTLCFMEKHCDNYKTIRDPLEMDDVVFYPCHNYDDFLECLELPVTKKKKSILLAHHLITHKPCMFKTYVTSEFLPCKYSAILFGDAHIGMEPYHDDNNTLVWNPGALARITISEVERPVKCGVVTVKLGKRIEVEEIYLKTAMPGTEVFEKSIIEQLKNSPEMVDTNKFIDSIIDLEASSLDIYDWIEKTASTRGISKDVVEYIMRKRVS